MLCTRRTLIALFSILALLATTAQAHHGWRWTTGSNVELTGDIVSAKLGNPHGVLTIQVNDEVWTVEVGQPWRNERAGIDAGDLAPGVEIKIEGEPSADIGKRLLKAERLWLNGNMHDLYPERR